MKNEIKMLPEAAVILEELEAFTDLLNAPVPPLEIQVNKRANNAKYLPIGYVQQKLDRIFNGLWETRNQEMTIVANEIVVRLELRVFHPVVRTWMTRTGVGAAMIQQKQGAAVSDINAKIKNTLSKDAPHAAAEALKNAAKSLGAAFGRDLNRDYTPDYGTVSEQIRTKEEKEIFLQTVKDTAAGITDLEELKTYWLTEVKPTGDKQAKQIINQRIQEIKDGNN